MVSERDTGFFFSNEALYRLQVKFFKVFSRTAWPIASNFLLALKNDPAKMTVRSHSPVELGRQEVKYILKIES